MEAKQDNCTSVTAAEEVQRSTPRMSRKERNKMIREKAKARVAQKRLMSNNNNGATFTTLIHSVINQARRRPALPITFSPMTQVIAPSAHLPHYAYAGYRVPNYGRENIVTGNTSSAPPPAERVSGPEPREAREDNNMVEIGNGMLRLLRMVWTTGGIPNGKRIDGIMYNHINQQGYIVCCCHGVFFTPAEFVIHAGGAHVDDPALHIHLSH